MIVQFYQMIIAKYEKDVSLQTQEEVNCYDFVMWATNNLLLSALDQEIIVKRYQQNLEIEAIADMYDITPEIVLLNLKTLLNIYKREKLEQRGKIRVEKFYLDEEYAKFNILPNYRKKSIVASIISIILSLVCLTFPIALNISFYMQFPKYACFSYNLQCMLR